MEIDANLRCSFWIMGKTRQGCVIRNRMNKLEKMEEGQRTERVEKSDKACVKLIVPCGTCL